MELTKFHYLVAVAELRSFSKAAEKCYVSQPALTRSVSRLEEELGVKLFDRSSSPIRLTYAGERYVEGMKNILAMKHQLDKEMEDIASLRRGRLSIGIPRTRSAHWLPQILPPYLESYPGIEVKVIEDTSEALEQALLKEEIDVSVIGTLPIMAPGLEYEAITEEQLMIVMPADHPVFKGNTPPDMPGMLHYIDPQLLHDRPFVSLTPGQGLYRAANQIFERAGIRPKTVLEISNTSTAYYLASGGLGFTISTVNSIETEVYLRRPVFCTLDDPPFKRIIIASYKKDRPLSTAARQFIKLTKRVYKESDALRTRKFRVVHDVGE